MQNSLIRKITPIGTMLPEIGTKAQGSLRADTMLQGIILEALISKNRLLAGDYNSMTGDLSGVAVQYFFADGTVDIVEFPTINIVPDATRKVYFANHATGTIIAEALEGQDPGPLNDLYTDGADLANRVADETLFPLMHVGQHQDTQATILDFALWIAPKKDESLPAGSIIAWMPGTFGDGGNGAFALALAATNDVTGANAYLNPRGWFACDGSALSLAYSPLYNAAGKNLPNLTDSRFLQGSTTAGGGGGSNAMLDHNHGLGTLSISSVAATRVIDITGRTVTVDPTDSANGSYSNIRASYAKGYISASPDVEIYVPAHGHALSGAIGSGLAPTATENRPKYLSCFFIIKVY